MASSRKKLDENNLKTLRELAALPQNKFCFDCGQRGPTYVNVTVGSFVCTKCSGILRGITPPHRVKSISMATFTTEEVDTIRNKGNDHCRKMWLGLYEGTPPAWADEQHVRDFMIEKYERKRYYLERTMIKPEVPNTRPWTSPTVNGTGSLGSKLPNGTTKNGFTKNTINNNIPNGTVPNDTTRSRPEVKNHHIHQNGVNNNLGNNFAVDFDKADIFSNTSTSSTGSSQGGFADFEHNQVYNATSSNTTNAYTYNDDFSIFDLQFSSMIGPTLNQVPLFPRCPPTNRWSMPTPAALNAWTTQQAPINPQNGVVTAPLVKSKPPTTIEDKYAALKDLDNEMKQHQHQDVWSTSTTGSTGSLYSSSTPNTGSAYGSPSPQGSIFGSPSQGQFMSAFTNLQETNPQVANPFGGNNQSNQSTPWPATNGFSNGSNSNGFTNNTNGFSNGSNGFTNNTNGFLNGSNGFTNSTNGFANSSNGFTNNTNGFTNGFNSFSTNGTTNGTNTMNGMQTSHAQSGFINPFKDQSGGKANGFSNGFQPVFPSNGLNNAWGGNPFKVGAVTSTVNPNNPFL